MGVTGHVLTSLITLPIRVGLRGAELGLTVASAVAERTIQLVGEVLAPSAREPAADRPRESTSGRPRESTSDRPRESEPQSERAPSSGGDPRSAAQPPEESVAEEDAVAELRELRDPPAEPPLPPPPPPPAPAPSAPVHLEDDDTLVEAVAEPGAEDGAGAQIRIAEPWEGFAQLKAADVINQLEGRDKAELAAIELYELSHRQRQTVIDAVKKELRRAENSP